MGRKKKSQFQKLAIENAKKHETEIKELTSQYVQVLENNPQYSLLVDPENKYNFTDLERKFIESYIEFKNIQLSCNLCGIEFETGLSLYNSYAIKEEIKRINLAMYHKQFQRKMLSIDEIGGYLSSLITEENVSFYDRLPTEKKLDVVKLLIQLTGLKRESLENPNVIMLTDFEEKISNLSLDEIKLLINQEDSKNDDSLILKEDLINKLNVNKNFTDEEISYLKTLSIKELTQLVDEVIKHE